MSVICHILNESFLVFNVIVFWLIAPHDLRQHHAHFLLFSQEQLKTWRELTWWLHPPCRCPHRRTGHHSRSSPLWSGDGRSAKQERRFITELYSSRSTLKPSLNSCPAVLAWQCKKTFFQAKIQFIHEKNVGKRWEPSQAPIKFLWSHSM